MDIKDFTKQAERVRLNREYLLESLKVLAQKSKEVLSEFDGKNVKVKYLLSDKENWVEVEGKVFIHSYFSESFYGSGNITIIPNHPKDAISVGFEMILDIELI